MADERCRITVVGERRRVDIAVPAHAPITEYATMLADMCGQDESDAMPPAWSLAPAGRPPFEPGASLGTAGVVDGETLYLRNVLDGEFDGPVVSDIEEEIAALEDDVVMWNARSRAYTTVVLGLVVLAGAAVALAAGGGAAGAVAAGVPLFATGLAAPLLAWSAARKHWPVPAAVRTALAAAACPLLTGAVLALPLSGLGARLAAALAAALIGALAAYLAAPSAPTMVLLAGCGLALLLAVPLVLVRANPTEAAAAVAVVVFHVLAVLPRLASQVATLPPGTTEMDDVAGTVRRVQRLLVLLNTACCLAIIVCLAVLSVSDGWFALGLTLCLGVALLCRASSSRLTAVVAALLLCGLAGLGALLLRVPYRLSGLDLPGWSGPLALTIVGVIVLWAGLVMCFRSSLQQVDFGERWRWPGSFAALLGAVSVPLAAGVFGVLQALLDAGRGL
ncbi:type VII secretion integral membrane protein EccD [Actinomadura sp. WMMB 499]|uniref:type VII secretion integral membrane protein EccD n=1 Tax=Actinomadura sp. WMMB 499 TaxID=1219491 RepID=UPI001245FAEC|nr:type VII secretion integral membrane protein EccD [Actinomadura sp. WMMB 499]QFG21557.1 type VII secretion integral membrane protein EccD [Actinomadura sp. WMMB 499]